MSDYLKQMCEAHGKALKDHREKLFRDGVKALADRQREQRERLGPNPQTQHPQRRGG